MKSSARALLRAILACGLPALPQLSSGQDGMPSFAWLDPSQPQDRRVHALISQMTLEEKVSQMRDHAAAIPRLKLPRYDWWNEGLHGVAFAGWATNFPQVIGMAATWDAPLVQRMAEVISIEGRAKFNQAMREDDHEMFFGLTFWAPNIEGGMDADDPAGLSQWERPDEPAAKCAA